MLLLFACRAPYEPRPADPPADAVYSGAEVNEGYGTRVVLTEEVWVGAPFSSGGRVYQGSSVIAEGLDGDFLGAGLAALSDGTVLFGAPGSGVVRTAAGTLLEAPGIGGVLAAQGEHWVASTPTGAIDEAGARTEWDRRPDALALTRSGTIVAGFARGDVAVRVGDTAVPRPAALDEAGFAVLVADLGADGTEEIVVGAPGAGLVYLDDTLTNPVGTGAGRFGAALAADADGTLYVGAPMVGGAAGAVYSVQNGTITLLLSGAEGEQLGASLSAHGRTLLVGAPGAADTAGSVRVVSVP